MKIDYTALGKRIAKRRKELGLKQYEVCELLRHGYSMSDLSDKHFYISNRSYRTMPVHIVNG